MHLLYAGTAAFYIKNMSVLGFEYLWGSWNHIAPQILREKRMVSTREKMGAAWEGEENLQIQLRCHEWAIGWGHSSSSKTLWREVNGSRVAPWRRLFQAEEQHLQKLHGVDVLGMPRAQQEAVLTGTAEESRAECFVICYQNCSFSLSTIRTHYWGSSRSYNSLKVYNFHSIIFPQLQPMSLDFLLWRRHLVLNKMQHPLIPTGTDVFPHSIEGEMEGVSKG